jgi:hypothetical protein
MSYKLLSVNADTKTIKSNKAGFLTGILYLAPYDLSGVNLCPFAKVAECHVACLNTAGRGNFSNVKSARLRRAKLFNDNRGEFFAQLIDDIHKLKAQAKKKNLQPVVRLNGTSDIEWENIKVAGEYTIFDLFPELQFYDYTKNPNRKNLPANYDLTFSYSGVESFIKFNRQALSNNMRVATVFKILPVEFEGRRVINGDDHDARFIEDKNIIVGLKAKGKARQDKTGFVIA